MKRTINTTALTSYLPKKTIKRVSVDALDIGVDPGRPGIETILNPGGTTANIGDLVRINLSIETEDGQIVDIKLFERIKLNK